MVLQQVKEVLCCTNLLSRFEMQLFFQEAEGETHQSFLPLATWCRLKRTARVRLRGDFVPVPMLNRAVFGDTKARRGHFSTKRDQKSLHGFSVVTPFRQHSHDVQSTGVSGPNSSLCIRLILPFVHLISEALRVVTDLSSNTFTKHTLIQFVLEISKNHPFIPNQPKDMLCTLLLF